MEHIWLNAIVNVYKHADENILNQNPANKLKQYLEMRTVKAPANLFKQWHHATLELCRLCGLKHFF